MAVRREVGRQNCDRAAARSTASSADLGLGAFPAQAGAPAAPVTDDTPPTARPTAAGTIPRERGIWRPEDRNHELATRLREVRPRTLDILDRGS